MGQKHPAEKIWSSLVKYELFNAEFQIAGDYSSVSETQTIIDKQLGRTIDKHINLHIRLKVDRPKK